MAISVMMRRMEVPARGRDQDSLGEAAPSTASIQDFDALFREEGAGVYRAMLAFTGGRATLAEEATAEAFARAIANRQTLRDPVAWIYRVAFRVATDELRKDRRRGGTPKEDDVVAGSPEFAGVFEALRTLPLGQRAAVILTYEADLPVAEVARRLGIAQPTVRVQLMRARRRLRELLGDEEVD